MLTTSRRRTRLLNIETGDVAEEPISVEDAKLYLSVKKSGEDPLIASMITAARRYVEGRTHRAIPEQNITATYSNVALPLRLHRPPVQSLVSITSIYEGSEEAEDTGDFYVVGGIRPEMRSGAGFEHPVETLRVVTSNGYTNVPDDLVQAIYRVLKVLYDYRTPIMDSGTPVPVGFDELVNPYVA